jgi:hypothetical protein
MKLPVSPTAGLRPHPSNWQNEPEKANTHCLYCKQPVPNHTEECVVPQRTVVVEFKTWMVVTMPQCFDEDLINFQLNESSACSSRYVNQLYEEANQEEGICHTCFRTEMKFLREATEEDHKKLSFIPKNED